MLSSWLSYTHPASRFFLSENTSLFSCFVYITRIPLAWRCLLRLCHPSRGVLADSFFHIVANFIPLVAYLECAFRRCLLSAFSVRLPVQSTLFFFFFLLLFLFQSSSRLLWMIKLLGFRWVYFISYLIRFRLVPVSSGRRLRSHQTDDGQR